MTELLDASNAVYRMQDCLFSVIILLFLTPKNLLGCINTLTVQKLFCQTLYKKNNTFWLQSYNTLMEKLTVISIVT